MTSRPPVRPGPGGHPPGQVGDGALGVAGRGEGVGGARPEGADVPEDADGAAGGGVPVGAAAPGDEQDEAEADQPGAERLRGLGGGSRRRRARPSAALPGRLAGDPGAGERAGAEEQGDWPRSTAIRRGARSVSAAVARVRGDPAGTGARPCGSAGYSRSDRVQLGPAGSARCARPSQAQSTSSTTRSSGDHGGLPGQQDRRPGDGSRLPGCRSSQSATRWATPPDITPPSAQASIATAGPPRPRSAARRVGVRAVQHAGDDGQGDDQQRPGRGRCRRRSASPGQPCRASPSRGAPSRRTPRRGRAGRGRRAADVVRGARSSCRSSCGLAAAAAAHHPDHGDRRRRPERPPGARPSVVEQCGAAAARGRGGRPPS